MGVAAAAAVAANVWGWWPLGATPWVVLAVAAYMCPPPEYFDIDSSAEKTAITLRHMRGLIAGAAVVWRIGPEPSEDLPAFSPETLAAKEGPPPTWWSPPSYTSLAAGLAAVAAALLDYGVSYALSHPSAPDLSGLRLDAPVWAPMVTVPVSAVFGWWTAQAVAHARRQVLCDPMVGTPPAARFDEGVVSFVVDVLMPAKGADPSVPQWQAAQQPVRRRPSPAAVASVLVVAAAAAGLVMFPPVVDWFGWPSALGVVVIGCVAAAVAKPMRVVAAAQRSAWEADRGEENKWRSWWGSARLGLDDARAPVLWEIADYPEGSPNPTYRTLLFLLTSGTEFSHVSNAAEKMATALGRHTVVIERFKQIGSTQQHLSAFSLSHELADLGESPHLNPHLDDQTLEFATRWAVVNAFKRLGLGSPVFLGAERITEPPPAGTGPLVMLSSWGLTEGKTFSDVAAKTEKLQDLLGCTWCRPFMQEGTNHLELVFGAHPLEAQFKDDPDVLMQHMQMIDWSFYMRTSGLTGTDGRAPVLEHRQQAALGLEELTFRYAIGMDHEAVAAAMGKLRSGSGYTYLELSHHPTEPSQFVLLIGDRDPLAGKYPLMDYTDQILRQPVRGRPNTDWAVGMTSSGRLLWYSWDAEEPHLLVAGASGSGKSGVINNMLCQILHNNHPDDVRVWLVEPKNELHPYREVAHVTRFLDSAVTDDSPHEAFAALMREAIAEMKRRYAAMATHPAEPQKLSEARDLARSDPETAAHLNFPYVFIVVEECSNYFTKPHVQDREAHAEVQLLVQKLAREARAAGIYLIPATQYPTKENIPMTLKHQCRRLGLPVSSWQASQVIIDQPGLEKLNGPGRGVLLAGSKAVGFRGLFMERSEGAASHRDDRGDIIAKLPKTENWPRLPEGVSHSPLVKVVGEPTERAPVAEVVLAPEEPADSAAASPSEPAEQWDNLSSRDSGRYRAHDDWDNRSGGAGTDVHHYDDGWDNQRVEDPLSAGAVHQDPLGVLDGGDPFEGLELPDGWENDPDLLALVMDAAAGAPDPAGGDSGGRRGKRRRRKQRKRDAKDRRRKAGRRRGSGRRRRGGGDSFDEADGSDDAAIDDGGFGDDGWAGGGLGLAGGSDDAAIDDDPADPSGGRFDTPLDPGAGFDVTGSSDGAGVESVPVVEPPQAGTEQVDDSQPDTEQPDDSQPDTEQVEDSQADAAQAEDSQADDSQSDGVLVDDEVRRVAAMLAP